MEEKTAVKHAEEFHKRQAKLIPPKDKWTPVDKALFAPQEYFKDYKNSADLTFDAVKYSLDNHYRNNELYKRLCEMEDFTPDKINSTEDYNKIPLLPDSFFKDYPEGKGFLDWLDHLYTGTIPMPQFRTENPDHDHVIDEFNKKGVSIMFTSGTSGRFSFIPRDTGSWNRLKYNVMRSLVELMDYDPDDTVILLIPDPDSNSGWGVPF
jgi:phenylacetate-coenzyme A ligase PaaK-like adenylate-forming protein